MINLCATGKSNLDGVTPMYLWRKGDYTYEIEYIGRSGTSSKFLNDTPYEVAVKKFENGVDKVSLV